MDNSRALIKLYQGVHNQYTTAREARRENFLISNSIFLGCAHRVHTRVHTVCTRALRDLAGLYARYGPHRKGTEVLKTRRNR